MLESMCALAAAIPSRAFERAFNLLKASFERSSSCTMSAPPASMLIGGQPLKVGDTVRVKKNAARLVRGRVGVIESFNAPGKRGEVFDVAVNFGWCNWGFSVNELEGAKDAEQWLVDRLRAAGQIPLSEEEESSAH
jgi:hypothetical protein